MSPPRRGVLPRGVRWVVGGTPLCLFVLFALALAVPVPAAATTADATIAEVMDAEKPGLPGVTATVNGSGSGYFGDSMRVTFENKTDSTYRVSIPIGLRFAPRNEAVQTMLTAGNETVVVPPGVSSAVFKAFCGEEHDRAPGAGDTFTPDGEVGGRTLDALKESNEEGRFDSSSQNKVWDAIDEDAEHRGDDTENARKAAATGVLTTAVTGAAAAGVARRAGGGGSGSTRPLVGDAAIDRLVATGHDTVEIGGKTYVLPPDRLRPGVDGIAFETKSVDGREVIDRDHVALVPVEQTTGPIGAADPGGEVAPPPESSTDGGEPAAATTAPGSSAVKLTPAEIQQIIDWGVKNNRTPEDIREDLDAQNQTAGGSGSVPVSAPPVRVKLGDGPGTSWWGGEEVTLNAEEAARHKKLRDELKALEPQIHDLRRELTWARIQVRKWMAAQMSPESRWVAGTWELIKRANRMDNPGAYLAKQNGFRTAEELAEVRYGKPRARDFVMTSRDYRKAVEAWRKGPQGLKYAEHVADVRSQAIRDIQSMTSPDPKGETSWFNRPKQLLDRMQIYQEQLIDELRRVQGRQTALTELERSFAERIRTGPVR